MSSVPKKADKLNLSVFLQPDYIFDDSNLTWFAPVMPYDGIDLT